MLPDGLYKVVFQTPIGAGAGVIYLADGKMRGGDSSLYYVGTYSQNSSEISASVTTNRHTELLKSVFGIDRVHINMRGKPSINEAHLEGYAVEAPSIPFKAHLSKLSD